MPGDAAAVAQSFTEDAISLSPGWKVVEGRAEIEKMYTAFLKAGFGDLTRKVDSVTVVGDSIVIQVVRDYATRTDGHGAKTNHAYKVLTVWRRGDDGVWRVYRDSFNDLPQG